MTEEPRGEVSPEESVEQKQLTRRFLEEEKNSIENGEIIHPRSLIDVLKDAGEKRFTTDIVKIHFDRIFELFRQRLKIAKLSDVVGHEGMHATILYSRTKDKIPDTETELHNRGKALLNLRKVYYTDEIIESHDSADETQFAEAKPQLIKEELKRLCNLFSQPLLNPEETKKILQEIHTKINELLDDLG